jgi:hypothetical protein
MHVSTSRKKASANPIETAAVPSGTRSARRTTGSIFAAPPTAALPRRVAIPVLSAFGATALRSFLGSTSTALEGLLTGRLEGTAGRVPQLRVKLGTGAGINQHFGAPEWRLVFAIELFDHNSD